MNSENIKISIFTNNLRGVSCIKYLLKKKIKINKIIFSKKNLKLEVVKFLKKKGLKFLVIKNLKDKEYRKF